MTAHVENRDNRVAFAPEELIPFSEAIAAGYRSRIENQDWEDVVQEIRLAALIAGNAAQEGLPVRSYQHQTMEGRVKNLLRDNERHNRKVLFTLDNPAGGEEDGEEENTLADFLPAKEEMNALDRADMNAAVKAALDTLPERERDCAIACFVEGESLDFAGQCYGITRERVRQIADNAKVILREALADFADVATA